MSTSITNGKESWSSPHGVILVKGLITVTEVTGHTCLIVDHCYDIDEVPNNGRNLHNQKLTKLDGSTATFSKPPSR